MNWLLASVRRAATLPGLRRLTRVDALLRLSFALRASLVAEPARFFTNELRPGDRFGTYRLPHSNIRIVLRHHTSDVMVLDEVFAQHEYAPPGAIEAVLRSLSRPLRVLDLGANIGLFGAYFLKHFPDATISAIEADSANADVQAQAIGANPASSWKLTRGVAGVAVGQARFAAGGFATSRLAEPGDAAVDVTTIDVLPLIIESDFLKIDIEGGEWAIMADPRWRETHAIGVVLEYHDYLCPTPDPALTAAAALREAGFEVMKGRHKPAFGAGIVWGWRS